MRRLLNFIWVLVIMTGCGVSKSSFSPTKKYSLSEVQKDYDLYQEILEVHHPSLYWYTPKDSMEYYFQLGRNWLKDSMTEPEFRKVLNYVTAKISCGHTSIRSSKKWAKYADTVRIGRLFPLSLKIWEDTMVVIGNLNRRDSILRRGTVITSINGRTTAMLADTLFNYISTDGYNRTHRFQTLSNRGFFGSLYTTLFGLSPRYSIGYIDSMGQHANITIPVYNPATDTVTRAAIRAMTNLPQPSRKERKHMQLASMRLLQIDSSNRTAMMNLASFGRGYGLKKFFRRSFRALQKNNIGHLIIDVRSNGGGSVTNSTLITRFLSDHRFKVGDSLFAIKKKSRYERHIQHHFWNKLFMTFLTRKRRDGYYHFGYFERHYFKPKKKNHFDGKVYIITGGNSFSATSLFASALKDQENVTIVGEETGGGAYGNSAWLIPDATLPVTGVRFRLPLFRLVIDKNIPKNGKGVQPEIESLPTVDAIRRNADYKLEKVMQLIREDKTSSR
jgi:hypothetical protein